MTTSIQTMIAAPYVDRLKLNTSTTTASLQPGQTLTNTQVRTALDNALPGDIAVRQTTMPATMDNISAATAGNGDTVVTDPGEQAVSYNSGFSDWLMNNPGLAAGAGLLIAWALYQLFTSKKRR